MRPQDPGDRFAAIARDLQHQTSPDNILDRIVEIAVEVVDGCDHAGISVADKAGLRTVAATDEVARAGDQKQYELGEGPCLDALHKESQVSSPRLATDQRWPRWAEWITTEFGIGSMLCVQLFTTEKSLGGLNLYSDRPDGFDVHDEEVALALAAHAAIAMAASIKIEHLNVAVVGRTVIGQAQGILMERHGIAADQAFAVLARVSQTENRRLNAVALDLVQSRRTPGA